MNYVEALKKLAGKTGYIRRPSWADGDKIMVVNGVATGTRTIFSGMMSDLVATDYEAYMSNGVKIP